MELSHPPERSPRHPPPQGTLQQGLGCVFSFRFFLYYFKLKKPPPRSQVAPIQHSSEGDTARCSSAGGWHPPCRSPRVTSAHPDLLGRGGCSGASQPPLSTDPPSAACPTPPGWVGCGWGKETHPQHPWGGSSAPPWVGGMKLGKGNTPLAPRWGGHSLVLPPPLPLKQGKCCGKRLAPLLGSWSDWFGVEMPLGGRRGGDPRPSSTRPFPSITQSREGGEQPWGGWAGTTRAMGTGASPDDGA